MPTALSPRKPEIMSPAGYWPQLRAAIEAGADSVYFGLKHFTPEPKSASPSKSCRRSSARCTRAE